MTKARRLMAQVGWMLAIWCLSVVALGVVAWAMRALMRSLGMAP